MGADGAIAWSDVRYIEILSNTEHDPWPWRPARTWDNAPFALPLTSWRDIALGGWRGPA
jgi:hypothetical protein